MTKRNLTKARPVAVSAAVVILLGLAASAVVASGFDLSWHTVDAGGLTPTSGGGFELNATLGQPDAGLMMGGGFELSGGFWAGVSSSCHLPADLNGDGVVDALDIQDFVNCIVGGAADCQCARLAGTGGPDMEDLHLFITQLLEDSP